MTTFDGVTTIGVPLKMDQSNTADKTLFNYAHFEYKYKCFLDVADERMRFT